MWVESVHLTDVRSYVDVQVDLAEGITTFIGRNGRGKTNFVEALGYVSTLRSHRVATSAPLIRSGAHHAVLRARIVDHGHRTDIDVALATDDAKRARINQSPVTRVRDILGILQTVLFAPEDLAIIKGDPGDRRHFVDDVIVQLRPAFAGVKADFDRVLKQRNALLKSARTVKRNGTHATMMNTLEVWNEQLIDTGAAVIEERCRFLQHLQPFIEARYAHIADGAKARLAYTSAVTDGKPIDREQLHDAFRGALDAKATEELDRGITLIGPHRDDVLIELNDLPAKGYASHGESWSLALALRLASVDLFQEQGRSPVLILDDVFAELDVRRREQLAELVAGHEQVLITAAVEADVPSSLSGARMLVDDGTIEVLP